jgi:hypothetical protein
MRRGISGGQKKRLTTGDFIDKDSFFSAKSHLIFFSFYKIVQIAETPHIFNPLQEHYSIGN